MAVSVEASSGVLARRDEVVADATALAKAGLVGRSLAVLHKALRDQPRDPELLYARALTLLDWGRLNEALAGLRAAGEAGLSSFGLFVNLCQVCHACGLTDEAEQHALRAIALDDSQAAGHLCHAVVLQARKRYSEAIERFERGYALAPERVDCLWEIVSCLLDRDDAPAAESVARRAIAAHGEDHAKSWVLLASALAMQKRWDEAMPAFERAEAIEARSGVSGDAFVMHAFQLFGSGRLDAAIELYRRYLPASANPGPHAHYGLLLLTAGRLREAWPFYEFRWTFDKLLTIRPRLGRPEWRGQELRGKRLLLWAEQGVGDIVQFVRLARAFKEEGATVLLQVPDRLREFAKGFRDIDRVVCEPAEFADGFDYHLSLMSASGALGIDFESIPSDVPYITVDEDRKRRWRERLTSSGFLRVGLAWAGNPTHEHDHLRSIALARLAPLFGVEGVRFYSLQKEPRPEDAGALPLGVALTDLAPELVDFRDTAAAIDALDLVLAVDTAVVHIAGALAKPVWVMLQTPPDFRWLIEGDDNPWYPTVRLFRQRQPGEWDEVIANVREALATAAQAWKPDDAPVELGPVAERDRRATTASQASLSPLCGIADTRYGIVQYLHREHVLARSLESYGEWLQPQLDIVAAALKGGSVVVDAGSGIGAHTLAMARIVGPGGSVFAYEPDAERMRVLFQNLQMNKVRPQVTLMERRLVRSTATGPMESAGVAQGSRSTPCDALDDLALDRLDVLKINSAAAADDILQGAADTLWRLRPLLHVAADAERFDSLARRVAAFGYRCWKVVTPYFSATNQSGRNEDIFGGRGALALVGVPEESPPPALLDAYEEVPKPDAEPQRALPRGAAAEPQGVNAVTRWVRALPLRRNSERKVDGADALGSPGDSGAVEATAPATAASRYNAAAGVLMRGDYERGFELYESRFDALEEHAAPARKFERSLGVDRRWRGGPLAERRIVIWCEQGFGDSLMMLRYLPLLKARGAARVMVVCERELVSLAAAMPAVDRVLSGDDAIAPEEFDLQCPAMSLPRCFRTLYGTVPKDMPYLTVPENRVDRWRQRLSGFDGINVGLAWAGAHTLQADSRRSIALAKFEPLLRLPGVRFVSLQKDRGLDDARGARPLIDWMSECGDFLETAALIEALDLVISVDTAVAHLAGALGKKVWLLNRCESEWRWGRGLSASVWYPTMTLFNQRRPDRWEDVIEDVAGELERASGQRRRFSPVHGAAGEDFNDLLRAASHRLQQGDLTAAEATFRDATRVRDDSAPAWNGLGVALALQDRHAEARIALQRACELEGQGGEPCDSFVNLANSFAAEGLLQEALAVYRSNLPARPSAQGHHNYALTLLSAGELTEGWRHYEFRWLVEPLRSLRPRYPQPQWEGQDLRGKTILLHCEQGLRDTIQFVRYAVPLKALGARVVLLVQAELFALARGFAGVDAVVTETVGLSFDCYAPLLSLPRVFGTELSNIPADIPYVRADPERSAQWRDRLAGDGGCKVGVLWAGSRAHARDRSRSVPLDALEGIFGVPGVRFYSFQKNVDPTSGEPAWSNEHLVDLAPRLQDFADTAAAISQMDLMVCVDTSVAHLAAALGKPVWMMLPRPADFRWLEARQDSPWYPTMRLFRQTQNGGWGEVIAQVQAALSDWNRGDLVSPVAPREGPRGLARVQKEPQAARIGHRPGMSAIVSTRLGRLQYLPDDKGAGDSLAWYGEYLQSELDLLERFLDRGSTVLEVGAGIGLHAMSLAAAVGREGRVYVSESRPVVRRILRQNLAANDVTNVTLMPEDFEVRATRGTPTLNCKALNELHLDRLNLVKANEIWAAMGLLSGAAEALWRLRPMLFLRAGDEAALSSLSGRVRDYGYQCWRIDAPLFNPKNLNERAQDIFDGAVALSLLAAPEEAETAQALDGFAELT